ncbi:MAG: O-methyltransferase family 3 [Chitinophagaceae bacterium]|nr:O-methyltransferase family 3 [Chitinophagaceae bacterium]
MKKYCFSLFAVFLLISLSSCGQNTAGNKSLDERVSNFLKEHKDKWHDLNVPYQDGQSLYDIIVKNNYQSALEIGTSTGHSTIWIAWALSKTGGTLITVEIDRGRYEEALKNIEAAGLSPYVDARLADAHELVKKLDGPFDFVFSDADKDWYLQYFKDVDPKLKAGGCFTAHNVLNGFGGIDEFLDYVRSLKNYNTTINRGSSSGISVSYKKQ